MLSLATVILSPNSVAISSSAGAIIRHGPHHSAQKSTSTGPSAPNTSDAKFWSVTVLVAMASDSPVDGIETETSIWALAPRHSSVELVQHRPGGVEQRAAHLAARKNDSQSVAISLHLRAV